MGNFMKEISREQKRKFLYVLIVSFVLWNIIGTVAKSHQLEKLAGEYAESDPFVNMLRPGPNGYEPYIGEKRRSAELKEAYADFRVDYEDAKYGGFYFAGWDSMQLHFSHQHLISFDNR